MWTAHSNVINIWNKAAATAASVRSAADTDTNPGYYKYVPSWKRGAVCRKHLVCRFPFVGANPKALNHEFLLHLFQFVLVLFINFGFNSFVFWLGRGFELYDVSFGFFLNRVTIINLVSMQV